MPRENRIDSVQSLHSLSIQSEIWGKTFTYSCSNLNYFNISAIGCRLWTFLLIHHVRFTMTGLSHSVSEPVLLLSLLTWSVFLSFSRANKQHFSNEFKTSLIQEWREWMKWMYFHTIQLKNLFKFLLNL